MMKKTWARKHLNKTRKKNDAEDNKATKQGRHMGRTQLPRPKNQSTSEWNEKKLEKLSSLLFLSTLFIFSLVNTHLTVPFPPMLCSGISRRRRKVLKRRKEKKEKRQNVHHLPTALSWTCPFLPRALGSPLCFLFK